MFNWLRRLLTPRWQRLNRDWHALNTSHQHWNDSPMLDIYKRGIVTIDELGNPVFEVGQRVRNLPWEMEATVIGRYPHGKRAPYVMVRDDMGHMHFWEHTEIALCAKKGNE